MAGAFPADMAVKKNIFIEEWNGKREITNYTFSVGPKEVPTLVLYVMLIPFGIFTWCRAELKNSPDPRYKDLV
jgi:hypothetical protein